MGNRRGLVIRMRIGPRDAQRYHSTAVMILLEHRFNNLQEKRLPTRCVSGKAGPGSQPAVESDAMSDKAVSPMQPRFGAGNVEREIREACCSPAEDHATF